MAVTKLLLDGNVVKDIKVVVAFPRKRARFRKWATVNLEAELDFHQLSGTEAKVLLVLLFSADKVNKTKDLSAIVGTPTPAVCRALRKLADKSLAERAGHGLWRVSRDLCHYGRWSSLCKQSPQGLDGKPGLPAEQEAR